MLTLLAMLMASTAVGVSPPLTLRLLPGLPVPGTEPPQWRALLLVENRGEVARTATPGVTAAGARVVSLQPAHARVEAGGRALFRLHLEGIPGAPKAEVTVGLQGWVGVSQRVALPLGIDLSQLEWEMSWQGAGSRLEEVQEGPPENVEWKPFRLPRRWQDLGVTWVRTRVVIPAAWQRKCLTLRLQAVDDRDAAFLNGIEIGRTDGWDRPRIYKMPVPLVRWGQENEIAIAVHNTYAGGGIDRVPIMIAAGEVPADAVFFREMVLQEEAQSCCKGR